MGCLLVFTEDELRFVIEKLGFPLSGCEINDAALLHQIQDAAFDMEIKMEYGEIDEADGEFAADLVTKIGKVKRVGE